jgi:hypothetical protein
MTTDSRKIDRLRITTWRQTLARYDVEEYRDGRWFMYDWTSETVASGRSRFRLLRLAAITVAYLHRLRADRRTAASWSSEGGES